MRYIRIFFTFLGYCTFIALVGAASFWYIGYLKNKKQVESTVSFQDISMTPEKTVPERTLPEFEPISRPAAAKPTAKAQKRKQPTHYRPVKSSTPAAAPKPVEYAASIEPAAIRAPAKAKPIQKPAKSAKARKVKQPQYQAELPPCTLSYKVTDNGASPRTGGRGVSVYETTELEKAVMTRMKAIKELEEAARQIRNPTVRESGIIKLFSSN